MGSGFGDEGRGILTEEDREWLLGNYDSGASNRKTRIKKRFVHLMKDLEIIANADPEKVAEFSELEVFFDHIHDESTEISPKDATQHLVFFAFVLGNSEIDFNRIAKSAVDFSENRFLSTSMDLKNLLMFHRALEDGIKEGKEYFDDETPTIVQVAANTKLYKYPTEERFDLDSKELTDLWRVIYEHVKGARGETPEDYPPQKALGEIRSQIIIQAAFQNSQRNLLNDPDITLPFE